MIKNFNIKAISDEPILGKKIILRVDYNVTFTQGRISDLLRITQTLPTINKLIEQKNKIVLCTHLGDPKGFDPKLSLQILVPKLSALLNKQVKLINLDSINNLNSQDDEICLLENLRFDSGETENDMEFAKKLARFGEIFVQDAFGVCHRRHASVVSLPKLLPSYAGLLLEREIQTLQSLLGSPPKPFVVIVGGAKIGTKLSMLNRLLQKADTLIVGGGLANTILLALGKPVGGSLVEKQSLTQAKALLPHVYNNKLLLPIDAVVENGSGQVRTINIDQISEDETILDIGPASSELFCQKIAGAKTVLWNGPLGKVEDDRFSAGTKAVFEAIAQNTAAFSVVGGGDTIAAIEEEKHLSQIDHISTGGGAMIEFIENGTLPGIEALKG